jgi:hypothetical protein
MFPKFIYVLFDHICLTKVNYNGSDPFMKLSNLKTYY